MDYKLRDIYIRYWLVRTQKAGTLDTRRLYTGIVLELEEVEYILDCTYINHETKIKYIYLH